jgi:hypothetical protein
MEHHDSGRHPWNLFTYCYCQFSLAGGINPAFWVWGHWFCWLHQDSTWSHAMTVSAYWICTPGGKQMLKYGLENNKILKCGTDGSLCLMKEMASFGWLLIGNHNVLVHGAGPVDGVPNVLSSTWMELFGIAAPNKFLFHCMKYYKIESTSKCVKFVDNHAAISWVNQTQGKHSQPLVQLWYQHCYSDCWFLEGIYPLPQIAIGQSSSRQKVSICQFGFMGIIELWCQQTGWKISEIDGCCSG